MNRDPEPCGRCARFIPDAQLRKDEDGPGYCEGFERPVHSTDIPRGCVLRMAPGSRAHRLATRSSQDLVNEIQQRDRK